MSVNKEDLQGCIEHVFHAKHQSMKERMRFEARLKKEAEKIEATAEMSWLDGMDPLTREMEITLQHQMMDEVSKEKGMFKHV